MTVSEWDRQREIAAEFAAAVAPMFDALTVHPPAPEPDPDNPTDAELLDAIREDSHR